MPCPKNGDHLSCQLYRLDRDCKGDHVVRGNSLKRFTLELGGNDAAIVIDDVEWVADKIYATAFINAGQLCYATKRV